MDKEVKSLTGIRGVAAIWVVFLHYFDSINLPKDSYIIKLFSNGIIAVDLFFLLSAFVMCLAYSEEFKEIRFPHRYKPFIKKRFSRVYPAYFFWCFMFFGFEFITLDFNYLKILVNLLLVQNLFKDLNIAGVFWSLSSEWLLYLIFPFLYFILYKIRVRYINVLLILVSLVGIYLLPSINNYFFDFHKGVYISPPSGFIGVVTGFNSIVRCLISYVIGINLFLLVKNHKVINYTKVKVIKFSAIIGIFIISYFGKSSETYVLLLICSIVIVSALYFNKEKIDSIFASPIIYFLGQISYSIYLCHMFILVFASILMKKFFPFHYDDTMQVFLVLGSLVVLIPISYLSYKFIELKGGSALKSKLFVKKEIERNTGQYVS